MLIQKYRPQWKHDYVFPNRETLQLYERWLKRGELPHVIIHGPVGTGKTTLMEIIFKALQIDESYHNLLRVDTADAGKDVRVFKKLLTDFIDGPMSWVLTESPFAKQVVFIDEADQMVPNVQQWLKSNIERTQHRVTYVMTTNHIKDIDDAVQRRCLTVNLKSHHPKIVQQLLRDIADKEGISASDLQIQTIVNRNGSNIARSINDLDSI